MPASSIEESPMQVHHWSPQKSSMHVSQGPKPVMGGGTLPVHAKAASTGTPPLLVLPLVLPLPLLLEPPLLPPVEDPDPELPLLTTGPELLPLITPELLPLPDEESGSPPSSWTPVGTMAPPHAARTAQNANADHREPLITVIVALTKAGAATCCDAIFGG